MEVTKMLSFLDTLKKDATSKQVDLYNTVNFFESQLKQISTNQSFISSQHEQAAQAIRVGLESKLQVLLKIYRDE